MNVMEGNIASPAGFKAAGIHAGLKKSRKDMAMIVSECPAVSAAAFTTNRVKAAPVLYDMKILEKGCARAVVVNSGNANACTGDIRTVRRLQPMPHHGWQSLPMRFSSLQPVSSARCLT